MDLSTLLVDTLTIFDLFTFSVKKETTYTKNFKFTDI